MKEDNEQLARINESIRLELLPDFPALQPARGKGLYFSLPLGPSSEKDRPFIRIGVRPESAGTCWVRAMAMCPVRQSTSLPAWMNAAAEEDARLAMTGDGLKAALLAGIPSRDSYRFLELKPPHPFGTGSGWQWGPAFIYGIKRPGVQFGVIAIGRLLDEFLPRLVSHIAVPNWAGARRASKVDGA